MSIEHLAALDLGSNSFHLIVATQSGDRVQVVDKIKEMVRLAAGLGDDRRISDEASERALACLERFGERLRDIPSDRVRVVGTNTLRKAHNRDAFIERAEQALGHEIEIISGREEARLVYLGAAHSLEDEHRKRLVADIGGGSTELIVGSRFTPIELESLYFGCVGLTEQFFPDGELTRQRFDDAVAAAKVELKPVVQRFKSVGWDSAVGTSGTINACQTAIGRLVGDATITQAGLSLLRGEVLEAESISTLNLPGVARERAASFPGGLAALMALFDALGLESMTTSSGALREGLLYDLLGRRLDRDIRDQTVTDLQARYHIDTAHAERVTDTALALFQQVNASFGSDGKTALKMVSWAGMLHEVGLDIAHAQYHKHGGYLLMNMDMAGFSLADQRALAFLVRAHRRKFPIEELGEVDSEETALLTAMAITLRLAVLLRRGRTDIELPAMQLSSTDTGYELGVPAGWLAEHPLTRRDLGIERNYLSAVSQSLDVVELDEKLDEPGKKKKTNKANGKSKAASGGS